MTAVPSTIGIVASGEDVLNDAVFWVDAGRSSVVSGALSNLGTGGSALNAVFGNSTGVDSFDPALLAHTGTNYLYLPGVTGNAASATNLASYTPSSSLQLDWDFTPSDLTAAEQSLITHFGSAGNRGWRLSLGTTAFALVWSTDGGDVNVASQAVSFATMGVAVGVRSRGRVILRFNNGSGVYDVRWYTVDANGIATLVETDLGLSTTSIFASSQNLEIGSRTGLGIPLSASVYKATVTTDGTVVFDANFTTGITSGGQTTFTESSANAATVTINRSTSGRKAVAVTRPILLFGTDDYLEVADNDLLDFAASEPFTVAIVIRQWSTFTSQGVAIAKKTGNGTTGTGWLIRNGIGASSDGTALDTYDGTTSATRAAPTSKTSGALCVITGIASSSQLTAYFNNTASAATTRQAGSYVNSEVMRIGRLSGASTQYVDMELVAAAVWRRALNANEIATIVARYT